MPLNAANGKFKCEACGIEHGYLPADETPIGDPNDLLGEMICTGCSGAGQPDTETSRTDQRLGNRHNAISDADVAAAHAFYKSKGLTWEAPSDDDEPVAAGRPRPAPAQ